MRKYIYSTSLFLGVVFTSISGKGINSKWVSSWRTERESMKNQPTESPAQITGGYPSEESENRKQNEYVEKIEITMESLQILCFVTRADMTVAELCPGSCYSIAHQHFAIVGCSTKKHPTGTEVHGEFVWKYCNTGLCNGFE